MITPTYNEKNEWARMANDMYRNHCNELGHRYSSMAALSHGYQITEAAYDSLMALYRIWLVDGIYGFTKQA